MTLAAVSAVYAIIVSSTTFLLLGHGEVTSACQVVVERPQIYEESDAIFVGTVVKVDRTIQFENGKHVTFQVSKSWKGVDTEYVTVHNNNDMCTAIHFNQGEEFLIFGKHSHSELEIPLASGSQLYDPEAYSQLDLEQLDARYEPIELKPGHAYGVNWLLPLQILGGFSVIASATFFIIRYRR